MALENCQNVGCSTEDFMNTNNIENNSLSNSPKESVVNMEFIDIKTEPIFDEDSIKKEPEIQCDPPPIWRPPDMMHQVASAFVKVELGHADDHNDVGGKMIFDLNIKEESQKIQNIRNKESIKFEVPLDIMNPSVLSHIGTTTPGQDVCYLCQKAFSTKGNLQRHMLLHTQEKYECDFCSRHFLKKDQLLKHLESHSKDKSYECQHCNKKFKTSSNLQQHSRVHLEVKPFQCDICLRKFSIKPYLLKHQAKAYCKRPNDEPLVCKFCGKLFEKEIRLRSHLRKHDNDKPFSCDTCNMTFKYKSTVMRHSQIHNGIRPYKCKYCSKSFTSAGLLKPHLRVHTGEKPFECPVCEKRFTHKHNMLRHVERHKKVKNLVCGICNKKFPKESRLVYHMKVHTNARPFACEICPKRFAHRQNILRHYKKKHPNDKYNSTVTDASVARDIAKAMIHLSDPNDESDGETIIP